MAQPLYALLVRSGPLTKLLFESYDVSFDPTRD